MLKVVYGHKGAPVPDYEVHDWVDYCVNSYLDVPKVLHDENGKPIRGNKVVYTSNETVLHAFALKVLEGAIEVEDIEFYLEDEKIEFDPILGLQSPKGKTIGIISDMMEKSLKLSLEKIRKEKQKVT